MRNMTIDELVRKLIQYEGIEVAEFYVDENRYGEEVFVAKVELDAEENYICPLCGEKGEKHGYKEGRLKRWRSLDFGKIRFYIESELPRVRCAECGVHTQKVPWALHNSDYTYAFELRVAVLSAKSATNLVAKLMRIKWDTVGNCVNRIQNNVRKYVKPGKLPDKLAIDETSHKKGYKYLTTVQDLQTGEIIWAHDGYGKTILEEFFKSYSAEELQAVKYIVGDGARYITDCAALYCPHAARCVDPFHVVQWANEALDASRKRISKDMKKNGLPC
jgi:transposase